MQKIVNKRRFGTGTSYSEFENDGSLHFNGDASVWTDFSVPLEATQQGANSLPDYDYDELGLLFPQNDPDETIHAVFQMPHEKKMGSDIYLHLHFVQDSSTIPTFEAEYRFYNNGDVVPSTWTSTATTTTALEYTGGSMLNIIMFPAISAPADETVSANLDIKLWRNDNDVTGDVLVKYMDIHYEIDTVGSREQYIK